MSDTNANLALLPWLRRGGTSALTQPDSLGAEQPGVATTTASLAVNDAPPISMPVRLMGPGHVTGLQTAQVIRMDPTPGSRGFEPNYFPLVEFDEPSLPWLFTPAAPNANQRLRPWLCLVVVRKRSGVVLSPPGRGSLPVLTIASPANPNEELPDLADSWAWAHAQVTAELPAPGPNGETDQAVSELTGVLESRPDRTAARLVCGRVLAANTEYLACVVPTFELGRLAGLGDDIPAGEEDKLRPAWTLGDDLEFVELPVYHSWEFATGARGDFQSLAMLLRARQLPTGVGQRPIDVSASGVDAAVPARTTLPLGGALRAIPTAAEPDGDGAAGTPSTAEAASAWSDEVHNAFRVALAGVLNAPDAMPADEPLLAPPRYGATQSGRGALDPARRERWYEQLNLEPEARVAAQFGTRLVQEQQEALVASAWEQAAELREVNAVLRHAQLGIAVASSLHRRHLSRMSDDALLLALAPARAQLSLSAAARVPQTGFVALMAAAQVPTAAFGTAMRRIARPQGAVFRRVARGVSRSGAIVTAAESPAPLRTVLRSLQPGAVLGRIHFDTGGIVGQPIDGLVSIERVALALQRQDITWLEASAAAVTGAPRNPGFAFTPFAPPGASPPVVDPFPVPPVVVDPVPIDPGTIGPIRPRPRPRPIPGDGRPRPVEPFIAARRRRDDEEDPFPFPEDPEEPEDPRPHPIPRDSAEAALFRTLAAAHLQRFDPRGPVQSPTQPFEVADLSSLRDVALARANPVETYTARIALLVDRRGGASAPVEPTPAALDAVGFTPRFPQPLAPTLAAMDQDLMLPGLDLVPPNTVVPLETNSPFVESVLVGFNDELGRELVWREFPTPLQATYADRFWDQGAVQRPADISPLAEWADRALGERGSPTAGADSGERFVVLLRSELLRRYPDAVVYAVKPDDASIAPAMPILAGSMEPDVRFFGFDIAAAEIGQWSIVIAEQPTAPRFGIEAADVSALPAGANHLPLVAGDGDAAQLALRLRQHPVRVTIPASVLLTPN